MNKFKLKKGDNVIVNTGKDKGKTGEITKVFRSISKVRVSGINLVKKHRKPSQDNPGKIEEIELPIHISNVSFLDPKTGKGSKLKYSLKDGKKIRISVASGTDL